MGRTSEAVDVRDVQNVCHGWRHKHIECIYIREEKWVNMGRVLIRWNPVWSDDNERVNL